jgi:hypothetical protein
MRTLFRYVSMLIIVLSVASCGGGGGGGGVTTGTATLSWTAPTLNDNGTALTDLAGFKIHYGTSPGVHPLTIDAGNVTTIQVASLTTGHTYYFVVTAYNTAGIESDPSNEGSKTIP